MRLPAFIFLVTLSIGCTTSKKATKQSNAFNGTWLPVKQEFSGAELPKSVYEKQKLIISDSIYTVIAENVDKGVIRYSGDNKMDIYGKEGPNAGKHFTAVYKFENEVLTVCYNLAGNSYPEGFETKGKPMFFMSVFKKEGTQ